MDNFEVNILGCGSALPTGRHGLSGQVLNFRNKLHMIDCGEGSQLQMRRSKLNFNRLTTIFISHLHGDHCFGIPGLLSTLGMLGRTADLTIFTHAKGETVLRPILNFFCKEMAYKVHIETISSTSNEKIYDDRSLEVYTIPLQHRVPTTGFLFKEKQREANIVREMIDFYQIPVKQISAIKKGADFVTTDDKIVPNSKLVIPAPPVRSYAYCSDTTYSEAIIPFIEGVDLLYHEATFLEQDAARACETYHSTARQAAEIAKKAGVKRLMLGHFSARYKETGLFLNEAKGIFPNTVLADDGLTVKI